MYQAVCILSWRKNPDKIPTRTSNDNDLQLLAAVKISTIIDRNSFEYLVYFPFIPYAVSLSLSIYYQKMRFTVVSTHRIRARDDLESACARLDSMAAYFHSAAAMASMGRLVLREMDRISSTVDTSRERDH